MSQRLHEAQFRVALERANMIRLGAAERGQAVASLPRELAVVAVAFALADPDELWGAMRINALLQRLSRVGGTLAERIIREVGIQNADKRVREMTARQRLAVAHIILDRWGGRRERQEG